MQYVFATNGHLYGEFDRFHYRHAGPTPFADFPDHTSLTQRYARDTGIDLTQPAARVLFAADSAALTSRYDQDAAIRAALEKVLRCQQAGEPARVLLALATGAGKTVIATNLLWRLSQAGLLPKPALFLCDRDELRTQAMGKLTAAFGDAARSVETQRGENAARNARVHIATYQTLGLDDDTPDAELASFLSRHYGENAFSVIVIDECHRSAWGRWSEVLRRNPLAVHIGLTATPRELRQSRHQTVADADITANNHAYFGEPVYEYTLIQAQHDGYLAACEVVRRRVSVDGDIYTATDVVAAVGTEASTGRRVTADEIKPAYDARQFDRELLIPERVQAMCEDLFKQLLRNGGTPEQKLIIFCTRDLHADRVATALNDLYAVWCREQGLTPKDSYAFKCTAEAGGQHIESMRGSAERHFIACTVDLLAAGVDIERLNAVVFFRCLESPISFYQMVGRGTRIHEATRKYKFWLYDYTGVTQLFGTAFITDPPRPPKPPPPPPPRDGPPGPPPPPPPPGPAVIVIKGQEVHVTPAGRFVPVERGGRDTLMPLDEYRAEVVERVLRDAKTLADFRALWVHKQARARRIDHLLAERYNPDFLRHIDQMTDYDLYDIFAHHGYHAGARTREGREAACLAQNAPWFAGLPEQQQGAIVLKPAEVLKCLGRQFARDGTEALESRQL